jgi:hypothetical protein
LDAQAAQATKPAGRPHRGGGSRGDDEDEDEDGEDEDEDEDVDEDEEGNGDEDEDEGNDDDEDEGDNGDEDEDDNGDEEDDSNDDDTCEPAPTRTAAPSSTKPASSASPTKAPSSSSTADAPSPSSTSAPNESSPAKWAVGAKWEIVLHNPIKADTAADIAPAAADIWDIDLGHAVEYTAMVPALKAAGKLVICYFNGGAVQTWDADKDDFPADVVGSELDGYADEQYVDIRDDRVVEIMKKRIDLALSVGCDAVDPDNVDAWAQGGVSFLRRLSGGVLSFSVC